MRWHQPNRVTRDIFGQNRGLESSGAICRAARRFGTLVTFLDFAATGTRPDTCKKTRNVLELKVGVLMFAVPAK